MQIKITIDENTHEKLKQAAKENLRSLSNEAFFRLRNSFTPTLTPIAPLPNPNPGIPVEPYKITLTAQTEGDTTAVPVTTPNEKTKQEEHPEWFNSQGKRIVIDDEPEPEWDADRGHTRP